MTPTVADLGQRVKSKYPGQYDDMDDADVGRRVKTKFPGSYDDFADKPQTPPIGATAATPGMKGLPTPAPIGQRPDVIRAPGELKESDMPQPAPMVGGPMALAEKAVSGMTRGAGRVTGGLGRVAAAKTGRDVAAGASDVLRGSMETAAPMALPIAVGAAPLATAAGLATGAGVQSGTEAALKHFNVPPEYAELGGDVAGIAAGGFAASKAGSVVQALGRSVHQSFSFGTPEGQMMRAVKPRSNIVKFDQMLKKAMPDMKAAEADIGKPIEGVDDALASTRAAKQNVWSQYEQMAGPARQAGATIDLTPVADAMVRSIPKKMRVENPEGAQSIVDRANVYRKPFSIQDAEELLKDTNAELDSYYAKYPAAQRSALLANPDTAQTVAQAETLRTLIYKALDGEGEGAAPRAIKQRYGALSQVEEELQRRRNVAMRQQPESLSEQIGKWHAAGQVVRGGVRLAQMDPGGLADIGSAIAQRKAATWLKEQQTTDALIRRAFKDYGGQTPDAPPIVPSGPAIRPVAPLPAQSGLNLSTMASEAPNAATATQNATPGNPAAVVVPSRPRAQQSTAGQGQPLPQPRQPSNPVRYGSGTTVNIPNEAGALEARYALRELEDVHTSHDGLTFSQNPNYQLRNDRDYSDPRNAERILRQAAEFNPNYLIADAPTMADGPPAIDMAGNVLGGNSRAMTLQRIYAQNQAKADQYRSLLMAKAGMFGVDPNEVAAMRRPVLVREVTREMSPEDSQRAVTDLNKVGTAQLTSSERAVADSRRVSADTIGLIGSKIAAYGDDGTLSKALDGGAGTEILQALVNDGVVNASERASLINERGQLTSAGKDRISKLMLGRLFRDSGQFEATDPSVRNKLESAVVPMSRIGSPEWDISGPMQEAIDILADAKQHGISNLEDLRRQAGMFQGTEYSPEAFAIARLLQKNPNAIKAAFRQYASDATYAEGGTLLGNAPTPEESFVAAFGR